MGYIGFRLGLSAELAKLAGAVTGLFVAFRSYQGVGDVIAAHSFLRTEWASALAMALLTMGGYFLGTRLLRLAERLVQMSFDKRIDRVGGLLVGLIRGGLAASVVLVICIQLPAPPLQESIDPHSLTGKTISRMAPALYDALSGFVRRVRD